MELGNGDSSTLAGSKRFQPSPAAQVNLLQGGE